MAIDKNVKNLIIHELMTRPTNTISRVMLLKKMWMHYQSFKEIDDVMAAFNDAGLIEIEPSPNHEIIYRMPQKMVEEVKKLYTRAKSTPIPTDDKDDYVKFCDEKIEMYQDMKKLHIAREIYMRKLAARLDVDQTQEFEEAHEDEFMTFWNTQQR